MKSRLLPILGLAWIFFPLRLAALEIPPRPASHVLDESHYLSPDQKQDLEEILDAFTRAKGHQVLVWILPTAPTQGPEALARQALAAWKPGEPKKDNGAVLVLLPATKQAAIQAGAGLRELLPETEIQAALAASTLPRLRASDVPRAAREGSLAVLNAILGPQTPVKAPMGPADRKTLLLILAGIVGFGLLLVLLGGEVTLQSKGKVIYYRKFSGKYADVTVNFLAVLLAGIGLGEGGGAFRSGGGKFGGGGVTGRW